jgi:hypothetical protein
VGEGFEEFSFELMQGVIHHITLHASICIFINMP